MKTNEQKIQSVLQALFVVMIPLTAPDLNLPTHLLGLVKQTPANLQKQFSLLLSVLKGRLLPILILFKFKRLSSLSSQDLTKLLKKMETHPVALFRLLFVTMKRLIMMGYYSLPEHWAETGFLGFANKGIYKK